jgi:hypothetical protein
MVKQFQNISAKQILIGFTSIAALLVSLFALDAYLESKIASKLKDPKFLAEIYSIIRPSAIFDSNESILIDMGAMNYIDSIHVMNYNKLDSDPMKIIVVPRKYLAHAPILSSIDTRIFDISAKRGKRFNWEYSLVHLAGGTDSLAKFRIEVIPN